MVGKIAPAVFFFLIVISGFAHSACEPDIVCLANDVRMINISEGFTTGSIECTRPVTREKNVSGECEKLPIGEIAKYQVYYGYTKGDYQYNELSAAGATVGGEYFEPACSVPLDWANFQSDMVYVTMTTHDIGGRESRYSCEVIFHINNETVVALLPMSNPRMKPE